MWAEECQTPTIHLPVVKGHIVRLRAEGVNCADAFEGYSCATTGGASADNQVLKQD